MRKDVIAIKDEIVTCEMGHHIYRVEVDLLRSHRIFKAANFTSVHEDLEDPVPNERMKLRCPTCGSAFIRVVSNVGNQLHFESGWRPDLGG